MNYIAEPEVQMPSETWDEIPHDLNKQLTSTGYWAVDTKDILEGKFKDKEVYENELRLHFKNGSDGT
ncbi:hypothetical protein IFM47457_06278 [Aspergillus lentulus]|nr:hypothetical protein IFM47457_06278 [Aspergillus lentulus]